MGLRESFGGSNGSLRRSMLAWPLIPEGELGGHGKDQMDDRIRQIDVTTMQERVYQELRNALYQGRFLPGEVLTIRSLAEALGTSPMPVREAIQRLVTENALTQLPNRTIRVASLTQETYDEWIRLRCEIEGWAAQRAAQRATPAICKRLREINKEFGKAI